MGAPEPGFNPGTDLAREATKILTRDSGQTGIYYDERGRPMFGSTLVHDPAFQDRVVAGMAFLATPPEQRVTPAANCGT